MLERKVEEYLRDEIKKLNGKAYKFVSPGSSGVPDRIVLLPGGHVFFVEVKTEHGALTGLQKFHISKIENLGNKVWVVKGKNGVDEFIKYCKEVLAS